MVPRSMILRNHMSRSEICDEIFFIFYVFIVGWIFLRYVSVRNVYIHISAFLFDYSFRSGNGKISRFSSWHFPPQNNFYFFLFFILFSAHFFFPLFFRYIWIGLCCYSIYSKIDMSYECYIFRKYISEGIHTKNYQMVPG